MTCSFQPISITSTTRRRLEHCSSDCRRTSNDAVSAKSRNIDVWDCSSFVFCCSLLSSLEWWVAPFSPCFPGLTVEFVRLLTSVVLTLLRCWRWRRRCSRCWCSRRTSPSTGGTLYLPDPVEFPLSDGSTLSMPGYHPTTSSSLPSTDRLLFWRPSFF